MDSLAALKAEIARKRKATSADLPSNSPAHRPQKRWRTKKEIDEEQEKAYYAREKAEADRRARERQKKSQETDTAANPEAHPGTDGEDKKSTDRDKEQKSPTNANLKPDAERPEEPPLSKAEVIVRLRALKEPATLFGETLWDRFSRMRELELAREETSKGQKNVFQAKMREMQAKDAEDDMLHYTGAKLPQLEAAQNSKRDKTDDHQNDDETPTCKEDYVYSQLRKYMRLWATEIDSMAKEERRTNKGRSLAVTHEQTKDWLKPLYKLLRKRKLPKNILDALNNIFKAAEEREYVLANSLYLEQLAIGNAPWPMGATMVGIHARAAREKIGEDKIAHVMNDERTRKYIQAVKRLLTVAQRHFPTSFSKMIM